MILRVFLSTNAQCGDRQMSCLESFDLTLSLDVPQMELRQLERSIKKPRYFSFSQTRAFNSASMNIQQWENMLTSDLVVAYLTHVASH